MTESVSGLGLGVGRDGSDFTDEWAALLRSKPIRNSHLPVSVRDLCEDLDASPERVELGADDQEVTRIASREGVLLNLHPRLDLRDDVQNAVGHGSSSRQDSDANVSDGAA